MYEYQNTSSFGKLYLLPKIYQKIPDIPGRQFISSCGVLTEKVSEFLRTNLNHL